MRNITYQTLEFSKYFRDLSQAALCASGFDLVYYTVHMDCFGPSGAIVKAYLLGIYKERS